MAGTTEVDEEVNESTAPAATETTPSNGGSTSPPSSPTGVGPTLPHSPPNPTPPSGVATSPSPTNVEDTHTKSTHPTSTDADETHAKSTPPTGEVTSSSDVHSALSLPDQPIPAVNAPGDDQEIIIRRPRSSRKRGRAHQEPPIFGAMKQEAILNPTPAPEPPVTTVATPPREGSTHAVQDQEQTPPPRKKTKRDGLRGINIGSSSGQEENPPPPSPAETAYSDSQILRNRKDKKGNVRWYYSSAGASSSSRKGKQRPPPPPSPPPWKPRIHGPELPYPCRLCEKGFYTIRSLSGHMKAHPGRDWRGVFPPPRYMIPRDQAAVVAPAADGGNINEGDAIVEEEEEADQRAHSSPELQENYDVVPPAAATDVAAEEDVTSGKGIPDLNGPPPPDSEEEDVRDED